MTDGNAKLTTAYPAASTKTVYEDISTVEGEKFRCLVSDAASPLHYHTFVEIIQAEGPGLNVTVGNDSFLLDDEDIIVILPGEHHSITPAVKGSSYILLDFDQNFVLSSALSSDDLKYILPGNQMRLFRIRDNYRLPGVNSTSTDRHALEIARIPRHIIKECTEEKRFYRLALRSLLASLALFILRQWEEANALSEGRVIDKAGIARIGRVIDVVNERYMDPLTSEDMADMVGMSYSYFSRFFKNTMNLTFSEYLNRKRVDEGERLLRTTDMPISEIAGNVGYSNTSYFIHQFRKRRMMTPKKYRLRYGK